MNGSRAPRTGISGVRHALAGLDLDVHRLVRSRHSKTQSLAFGFKAEHAKAVTAMNAVFDLFPADFRPDPNLPPPGRGRGQRS